MTPAGPCAEVDAAREHPDLSSFNAAIRSIGAHLRDGAGAADLQHLRRIERMGYAASLLGLLSSSFVPNPVSAFLIAQGMMVRFTIGHHIGHGAYDRLAGAPARLHSNVFARGWRRFIDWPEWWRHEAWLHLHNTRHHPFTQDPRDADLMNARQFRSLWLPIRYLALMFFTLTWKFSYYAPRLDHEWQRREQGEDREPYVFRIPHVFDVRNSPVRDLWLRCYLPYLLVRFGLPTLVFSLLGSVAAMNVLVTLIFAELIHNAQGFICIRSSHSAPDLPIFNRRGTGEEFAARQVLATSNYRGGSDLSDALHGWTNYQVEHHLWPGGTLLQLQRARPLVQSACTAHGIPYLQEHVWRRYWLMSRIFLGLADPPEAESAIHWLADGPDGRAILPHT